MRTTGSQDQVATLSHMGSTHMGLSVLLWINPLSSICPPCISSCVNFLWNLGWNDCNRRVGKNRMGFAKSHWVIQGLRRQQRWEQHPHPGLCFPQQRAWGNLGTGTWSAVVGVFLLEVKMSCPGALHVSSGTLDIRHGEDGCLYQRAWELSSYRHQRLVSL